MLICPGGGTLNKACIQLWEVGSERETEDTKKRRVKMSGIGDNEEDWVRQMSGEAEKWMIAWESKSTSVD